MQSQIKSRKNIKVSGEKAMPQHSGADERYRGGRKRQLFHGPMIEQPVYETTGKKGAVHYVSWYFITSGPS